MLAKGLPKYCRQKEHGRKDRAYIYIDRKKVNLGLYDSEESRQRYAEIIADLTGGPKPETPKTVSEVLAAFLDHAMDYYNHREFLHFISVVKIIRKLAGPTLARDFGPKKLKQARKVMIDQGRSRKSINRDVVRARQIFTWAVEEELIPALQLEALRTVKGLRAGRTEAKERPAVPPVPDEVIDATLPHLSTTVADMVRVHRLIGCRPDEICGMRPGDIDRSGEIWCYIPESHKNSWRGKSRQIAIGPKAQAILKRYLFGDFCFTAMPCGRPPGRFAVGAYRQAVRRAAKRAGVEHWTPGQIRHTTATETRRVAGLDGAQAILGHATAKTTEIYAELDFEKAAAVARALG